MIEVTTRLSQGVYLAGEIVECAITFKSPSPPADAKSSWNEQEEVLALASAQIYCQCRLSETQVAIGDSVIESNQPQPQTNSRTSFAPTLVQEDRMEGGNGLGPRQGTAPFAAGYAGSSHVVSSTKPTILFCDLRLLPGESRTFWYRETIPVDGPPSFRGQTVRYAYKLTVGTQRINSPMKLHHVQLRVLVLQEFTDSAILNGSEYLTPSNPFLSDQEKESHIDSALQILQVVTSQRNQKFYNVTNSRGHVVKFCTFKQAYKLGEDIVGSLDFSESNVPCIQYAVTLQSVEEISPECRKSAKQKPALNSYSKFHEMVIGYLQTHFVLPVPLHITPSFHTDIINLKWRLHFEFVTSTSSFENELSMKPSLPTPQPPLQLQPPPQQQQQQQMTNEIIKISEDMDGQFWQGPSTINIETMVWDLPIKLYPNLPSYLSQGLQMQTRGRQCI